MRSSLWRALGALAMGAVGALTTDLAGAAEDPFRVVLSAGLTRDANVFRLSGSVDPQTVLGKSSKSDEIRTTSAGLRIDKPYSQQRFQLDLTETAYRYKDFSFLNFDALDHRAAWLWHLSPRLSGTLSSERHQALASFADFRSLERNVQTSDIQVFSVDGWVTGSWHVLAAVSQSELKNSVPFREQLGYRSHAGEAGIKYQAGSGSSVSLIGRSSRANYLNRDIDPALLLDNGFRQTDAELRAHWIASGRSIVNATATWLDRRHENFAQRDFSGLAGRLEYVWTPTGRLQLTLSGKRDIASWWDLFSSYNINKTLAADAIWRMGAKTAVHASLSRSIRDFRGPVIAFAGPSRSDTTHSAALGLDWLALRSLTVSAGARRERRSSTFAGLDYDDSIVSLSVSLMLF